MTDNRAFDLFLLMANLAQVKDRDRMITLLIESMNAIFPELTFTWTDEPALRAKYQLEVCTRKEVYGFINYTAPSRPDDVTEALISNAGQMLAIILENLKQENLLIEQNQALQTLAEERARMAGHLEARVAERTAEMEAANKALAASRLAALNMMADAVEARQHAEETTVALQREITERKQAEATLRESEERYRLLFNSMTEGFALHDIVFDAHGQPCDYRFLDVNPAFERLTNLKREDIIGKGQSRVLPDEDPFWLKVYSNVALTGEAVYLEHYSSVLQRYFGVFAYSPGPNRFAVIFSDITDRKRAEAALRESEEKYRLLAHNVSDVLWILNLETGQWDYLSPSIERLRGYTVEEVMAQPVEQVMTPESLAYAQPVTAERSQLFLSGAPGPHTYLDEIEQTCKDGSTVWTEAATRYLRNEQGQLSLLGVSRDISDRKLAEAEIKKLNAELEQRVADRTAQLEEANRELEAFAYSVSHDLRAPLRAIDGFSRFVVEDYGQQLDAEGNRLLTVIRANAQKMDRLITDLLAFSRVGRAEIRFQGVNMIALAQSVYNELVPPDESAAIAFSVDALPPAWGDPALLRQVWVNLIANALKYTRLRPERRIEVSSRVEETRLVYFVKDNGVGFNQDYAHKLFGVFQRLHKADEFEGTGIGLSIVQRIIVRHGGQVWAEGVVNAGATFYFCLPLHQEDTDE